MPRPSDRPVNINVTFGVLLNFAWRLQFSPFQDFAKAF